MDKPLIYFFMLIVLLLVILIILSSVNLHYTINYECSCPDQEILYISNEKNQTSNNKK